ncbi:MAG: class I SAM-dependent methyltransferase [Fimbriimonadaceae bacterium]|nr:class I SAM-dependent methyltransferase [Fimbriimonadaceae bacterium]
MPTEPFEVLAPFYDQVMARVPYAEWADYLELLLRHWRGERGDVLDLACGTGAVGLELARRGSRVVGVDLSRAMLREGRRKALAAGLDMRFVQQDLRALGCWAGFDLAVCLFDSLNYLLELDDLRQACRGTRLALRQGGLFIFDVNTELALALELFTQEDLAADAPVRLRWKSRYDKRRRLTTVAMEFYLDDGQVVRETHLERAFTPGEIGGALQAAGFETLAVYDAYTFDLPRSRSDRLFYVCQAT